MALGGLDKKYQEILETLQRGDGVTAEKLLVPLIKRFPQADGLKEALGHAQWLQGRRNAAVKTWREAHYEEPRNAVITSHLVQALMEIKDYDQAERIIRRTLSHQPGHSALQAQLARILEARAQPFDAVEAYLAAAQRDSKNPKLWMAVLQAALQAQDYPNARTAGETLFSISPTPGATRGLIDAYRHLGRPDLAAEVLATCLSRWPRIRRLTWRAVSCVSQQDN
ncbi:MAG: tetratricopeptide repeat protein [Pseudomonadota bacterium]